MKKIIVFDFEGLIYSYDENKGKLLVSKKILAKIEELKKKFGIVLLTNFKREDFKKIFDGNLFNKIYFLNEFSFSDRIKIFDIIEKDYSSKIFRYYIGELSPFMDYKEIKKITQRVEKDVDYLDVNKEIKNFLVSFDLDGVLNDISSFNYEVYKIEKSLLEKEIGKTLSAGDFFKTLKEIDESKRKEIKKKALLFYQENEKIAPWIKSYIENVFANNKLVLFSVTSRERINSFLKKHKLSQYFSKIYSTKDDFDKTNKETYMFEKIKKEWKGFENFIHIGDQFKSDYIYSKKAGFIPYLVDNSSYDKITFDDIGK
jgi:HAD superfamily hydrolase (TIGR01549 family)